MTLKILPVLLACLFLAGPGAEAGETTIQLAQGRSDDRNDRDRDRRRDRDRDRHDRRRGDDDDRSRRRAACTVYEHNDFRGWSHRISSRRPTSWVGNRYNDRISSVQVSRGCSLRVYEHRDFKGRSHTFRRGRHDNMPRGWNDRISSAKCRCR